MTRPCAGHCPGLSAGEIHVWTARLVDDHHATAEALPILSEAERARAAQFSFERDRLRFIQAHGMLRHVLASYCDTAAGTLKFARNRHGKPYLVHPASGPHLQFSLSHSCDCCMLAVRLDHPVGIDVEQMRDLPRASDIALSYFTPAEGKALAALQGTAQRDSFLALWTHKEATVKGLGTSLAGNLGCLEFDLDAVGRPRLLAWGGDRSVARRWSVLPLDVAPGYVAAVASVHPILSMTQSGIGSHRHRSLSVPGLLLRRPPIGVQAVDNYWELCNVCSVIPEARPFGRARR